MTPRLRRSIIAYARAWRAYAARYEAIYPGPIHTDKELDRLWTARLDALCDVSAAMRASIPDVTERDRISRRLNKAAAPRQDFAFWNRITHP